VQDGMNANREAKDYQMLKRTVSLVEKFSVKSESGGGFVMKMKSSAH
jgi:hypothetical protein